MRQMADGRGRSRRVRLFLGGTFLVTWGAWWLLAALTSRGVVTPTEPLGVALLVLGGTGPTVVAYLAVWRTPEVGTLRGFTRKVFHLRVPPGLVLVAVFGAAGLGIVSLGLTGLITGSGWSGDPGRIATVYLAAFVTSILFGGIEEVGWRGVLQPAVTDHVGLVPANLVIAVVWSVWHLPLFWVVGGSHQDASFTLFLIAGVGYSAVMTWLYARTRSVALCVLFHAGINASAAAGLAFPVDQSPGFAVQAAVLVTVGTVLLVVSEGRRHGPAELPGVSATPVGGDTRN
jgi:uncharacterized protein